MSASAQPVDEYSSLSPQPATEGLWEVLDTAAPFPAAHAALLPTGKVLLLPGGRKQNGATAAPSACLLDPQTLDFRTWELPTDFSLGAQCFLPDGRLLISGAGKDSKALGTRDSYLFDAAAEDFLRVNDMSERGPCPTLVGLGDGTVLAVGGGGSSSIHAYDKTRGWASVGYSGPDWPLYPQLIQLASGGLFYSGQHFGGRALINPGVLRPDRTFTELPQTTQTLNPRMELREQGAAVLLPPAHRQQVMVIGGGSAPSCDVNVVDFSEGEPAVNSVQPRHFCRANFNTVVLPDHTVLVCGGVKTDGAREAALEAELFDPATATWRPAASAGVPRPAHSSAVLLPDGRVLTAGSTDESGNAELRVEVYHPPYLFTGARPVVEKAPAVIRLGQSFGVETADSDIRAVTLVKPMAVSHGIDCDQRHIEATFESGGKGRLEAVLTDNPNVAPPGRYLLFLINHRGTPSLGQWVQVEHPGSTETGQAHTELRQQPLQLGRIKGKSAIRLQRAQEDPEEFLWDEEATSVHAPQSVRLESEPSVQPPPVEELKESLWSDQPTVPPRAKETKDPLWFEEEPTVQPIRMEEPEVSRSEEPQPAESSAAGASAVAWYQWARPAFIVGSAGLLTLSMVAGVAALQAPAAVLFLLFAPGLALVGLRPPAGWATLAALSMGLSLAIETLLTLAGLYLGIWSAQGTLLVLMGVSLAGAAFQLVRTALGEGGGVPGWERLREVPA